ncbi:glycosyltransferase [Gordonia rubripertincta]|uniref:glycosyltransferase n=1 Tax=Gordonia rubripertincta TaxID=36822 RepID=UPI00117D8B82|nr:glycosyltransferase [Gordonia rubripertincta]TSD95448.1 glycosyltransferase [Gordonia rubripertincta]
MIDGDNAVRRPGLAPIRLTDERSCEWEGAVWIGQIDLDEITGAQAGGDPVSGRVRELIDGNGFHEARILVWDDRRPLGFVEIPVEGGTIDDSVLAERARELATPPPLPLPTAQPGISVVVCTRDRPNHLARLLESVGALDYPDFEVVVVDNNPASGLTPPVVDACPSAQVRLVSAVGKGLSIARNVGLRAAKFDLVAFTDDDVVLDRNWLSHLIVGFDRDQEVACVCGLVPSAEVMTPSQAYFDSRVGWAERWAPALYGMTRHTGDDELFPLRVSEFGTGANFAVRRDVVVGLGGFDEALGAGSAAGSGEDMDIFVRILLSGRLVAREPAALVWHSHRETVAELEQQMYNYGVGLSAMVFKLLVHPRTGLLVTRRLAVGVRHLGAVTETPHSAAIDAEPALAQLRGKEIAGVLRGPWQFLRGRLAGRSGAPLTTSRGVRGILDFRNGQIWGDAGNSILEGRLAAVALWIGLVGCLGATTILPGVLQVAAVTAFVVLGPGSLAMSFGRFPVYVRLALIPVVGLALCMIAVTVPLLAGFWNPAVVLGVSSAVVTLGGLARGVGLASRVVRV